MIATVRESKARLSELIAKATSGEEVVITLRGKPAIKLVPISNTPGAADFEAWARRLRSDLKEMPMPYDSSAEIMNQLREDRI